MSFSVKLSTSPIQDLPAAHHEKEKKEPEPEESKLVHPIPLVPKLPFMEESSYLVDESETFDDSDRHVPERCSAPSREMLKSKVCQPHKRICEEASNIQTPIGLVCLQSVFDCIPSEWLMNPVHLWPAIPPEPWQHALKKALLSSIEAMEGPILITERLLDEPTLAALTEIAYQDLINLAALCAPQARPLLASKKPFDLYKVIRKNVERDPLLDADLLAELLVRLGLLLNHTHLSAEELRTIIYFFKAVCSYPAYDSPYPVHDGDALQLFILQMSSDRDFENVKALLEACKKVEALLNIDAVLYKGIGSLHKDSAPLSKFIDNLYAFSSCLDEETFPSILCSLRQFIVNFQRDNRPMQIKLLHRHLWHNCHDLIYGFTPFLESLPICKKIYQTLDSLPRLFSYEKALEILVEKHFPDNTALASKFYKSWWYCQYRSGKPHALAERLVDWEMHQNLVSCNHWGLGCREAVQMVKDSFRRFAPIIPFNAQRAEAMYHSLHLERRKQPPTPISSMPKNPDSSS